MAFLYYQKDGEKLINRRRFFSLAGYNLIFRLWESRGKPTDQGWHVTTDDLIKAYTEGSDSHETGALIIDFRPSSKRCIGLIELLDIYLYTYSGAKRGDAGWSPMMLRFRDILYEEYDSEFADSDKIEKMREIRIPANGDDFVEFLYLNGSDKGWNWGMNGMTNAAFIQGPARDYFRQYF